MLLDVTKLGSGSVGVAMIDSGVNTDLESFYCYSIQQERNSDHSNHGTAGAQSVCRNASGGRDPIGPEIDQGGSHKVQHYHQRPRGNSHCFFGSPRA